MNSAIKQTLRALCLLGCAALMSRASAAEVASGDGRIAPLVETALRLKGKARVLIKLQASGAEAAVGRKQVAKAQDFLREQLTGAGYREIARLRTVPWVLAEISPETLEPLRILPDVRLVAADTLRVEGTLLQSGRAIGAYQVQDELGYTGAGSIVGIIDSGIDADHPDLADAIFAGRAFLDDGLTSSSDVTDDHGHGTHNAGTITSNGIDAPRGIAPASKLVVVRALSAAPDGSLGGFFNDVLLGFDWILDNHAAFPQLRFINMSFAITGEGVTQCPCDGIVAVEPGYQLFLDLVDRAEAMGITCISSAGNDGDGGAGGNTMRAPACFSKVVSVGATYDNRFLNAPTTGTYNTVNPAFPPCTDAAPSTNTMACFSSRGSCLDFVAPGYNIRSAQLGGGNRNSFGTSMAAAHVTGALALMQSIVPQYSGTMLLNLLHETSIKVSDPSRAGRQFDGLNLQTAAREALRRHAGNWTVYQ